MKNIFKYSILAAALIAMTGLTACQTEELDTDQYAGKLALAAIAPNPVMRGGQLRIIGANLDQVTEVRFTGGASVTSIEKVAGGARSEIRVTVPVDGTDVGPVTVVGADGLTASTRFDLEYTEPMVLASFSPAEVLSGDVVTVRGEYLNNVREIILGGVYITEFGSQSRNELTFTVPSDAVTGYVIISDVNELEDQSTIPNQIYSDTELVVGDPTVAVADTTTYKSGDVITVTGSHLDMIKSVDLKGASDVEFKLAEGGNSISFNLPPSASDGQITLTSFAGKEFPAGAIISLNVTDLSVESLAEDGRFKAGTDVSITGSDLDLVTKVEFTGAEAQWYLDGESIVATVPDGAKDGGLTVTLGSGKQAYSPEIEVVKPVAEKTDVAEVVAGQEKPVYVTGTDLDLVTSATIGDKDHGLITCEFKILSADSLAVSIPKDAYNGVITLTAASGYDTATEALTVTYDESVSVTFTQPSYALGKKIEIGGKNLLNVEQIFIKGKKVVSFAVRGDDNMSFDIPEGIGPGVYRLAMVLVDGTELTWPVPFEITAPFTEKTIWEGSEIVTGWSGKGFAEQDAFINAGIKESDVVRIYFNAPEDNWWDIQLVDGHWSNLSVPELDGGNEIKSDFYPSGSQMFSFAVTPEILAQLTKIDTWGNAFIINGDGNIEITRISLIQFGAAEEKNAIWEGSHVVDWSGGAGEDNKAMSALSWGGYDWSTVEPGTKIVLEFTPTADEVQIRFSNGSWAAHPGTPDPYKLYGENSLEIELTKEILDNMVATGGLVITGQGYTLTGVYLVTSGPVVPTGTTIWEGSANIDWSNPPLDGYSGSMGDLSWGGYDWSTVEAGTTIRFEFSVLADHDAQMRVSNGSWAALPGTSDPYVINESDSLEIELTQAMIDELVGAGGLVMTGQFYTLTAIILK